MIKVDKKLFWDTDWRTLDDNKHADFIIGRVLQRGDLKDFKTIRKKYSLSRIKKVAANLSYSDKKSRNFWHLIFRIKRNQLCTQRSSPRDRDIFLKR